MVYMLNFAKYLLLKRPLFSLLSVRLFVSKLKMFRVIQDSVTTRHRGTIWKQMSLGNVSGNTLNKTKIFIAFLIKIFYVFFLSHRPLNGMYFEASFIISHHLLWQNLGTQSATSHYLFPEKIMTTMQDSIRHYRETIRYQLCIVSSHLDGSRTSTTRELRELRGHVVQDVQIYTSFAAILTAGKWAIISSH